MKNTLRVAILTAIALASPLAMADTGSKGSSDAVADPALAVPDILFARPAGLAGTTLGFAAFVVSSPFTAMAECVDEAWDTLVITPRRVDFHPQPWGFRRHQISFIVLQKKGGSNEPPFLFLNPSADRLRLGLGFRDGVLHP